MTTQKDNGQDASAHKRNVNHMPDPVALLSNVDSANGIGLNAGDPGRFCTVDRNAKDAALSDMEFVVRSMVGMASERNSIPDIRAQSLCFRYMLRNCSAGGSAVANTRKQWRGALWAYLLSPLLMFPFPGIRWRRVEESNLAKKGNLLGNALHDCLPSPGIAEWRFLTLRQKEVDLPILDYSADQLAVPATSLEEIETGARVFPWIEDYSHFADPLRMMSLEALELADRWLGHALNGAMDTARQAAQLYRRDVLARKMELDNTPAFEEVWETVLQALLLRDLVETDVSLFSLTRRLNRHSFEQNSADALTDNAPLRGWDEITSRFAYGIMLGGHFAGFLDRVGLLWMPAPGYLQQTEAFRAAQASLSKALSDEGMRSVCQYRMRSLLAGFGALSEERRQALYDACENSDLQQPRIFTPAVHRMRADDVTLLEPLFDTMSRLCGHHCSEQEMFPQAIYLYTGAGDQLYGSERYSRWAVVRGEQDGLQGGDQSVVERALLPLTASGATIVRNSEAQRYVPSLEIRRSSQPQQIRVTLRVDQGAVTYEWSKTYGPNSIHIKDSTALPAVCYWPNGAPQPGEPAWKMYYTYVNFHEGKEPIRNTSAVYDMGGRQISRSVARLITLKSGDVYYAWQTHPSERLPSFCTVEENGGCMGCVLFDEPNRFPTYAHQAVLAVDFGTTSTTGAVMLDVEKPGVITVPKFRNSVLKWEMNANQGIRWSLEQFIANRFNCVSRTGGDDAFFSALARFAQGGALDLQDEGAPQANVQGGDLFTDGHIYFFGNSVHDDNPMGNPRYFGLKLKDLNRTGLAAGGNISMFLEQVIEMYLLYCRLNGARVTQVRFAFPLAFEQEQRQDFQNRVSELVSGIALKAGMENCTASFVSESQAVSAYFSNIPSVKAGDLKQGIITLDIGGGTADYSYCRAIADQSTLCDCYSSMFGGHALVGRYAFSCKPTRESEQQQKTLNWFIEGLQAVAIRCSREEREELEAFQKTLTSQNDGREESFIFAIERFISLKPALYAAALKTTEFTEQYTLLLFELMLLLWFGYLLGSRTWTRTVNCAVRIFVAGNGANLYDMIRPDDLRLIAEVAGGGKTPGLEIVPNIRLKREVAEGLLLCEDKAPGNSVHGVEDGNQLPEELWAEFQTVVQRFIEVFWERKSRMIECLVELLSAEDSENTYRQFLKHSASLTDLCTYLPAFCEIVIDMMNRKSQKIALQVGGEDKDDGIDGGTAKQ